MESGMFNCFTLLWQKDGRFHLDPGIEILEKADEKGSLLGFQLPELNGVISPKDVEIRNTNYFCETNKAWIRRIVGNDGKSYSYRLIRAGIQLGSHYDLCVSTHGAYIDSLLVAKAGQESILKVFLPADTLINFAKEDFIVILDDLFAGPDGYQRIVYVKKIKKGDVVLRSHSFKVL